MGIVPNCPMRACLELLDEKERIDSLRKDVPWLTPLVVDESVGQVMKKLDELGIAEETVIIFTSDNGGVGRITSAHPLRGNKGNFYEGGIRVPLIVKWPGVVKPNSECRVPVTSTDFYPTILAMAGVPPRPRQHVDGKNIVPLLK